MTKNEFFNKWLDNFGVGVSKKNLKKYVVSTGSLLWHVFSFELLDPKKFLIGDEAKAAYDKINKQGALYIEWFKDKTIKEMTLELNTASALDKLVEVYVVSSDFSWTYIKTHESTCGPYFMQL